MRCIFPLSVYKMMHGVPLYHCCPLNAALYTAVHVSSLNVYMMITMIPCLYQCLVVNVAVSMAVHVSSLFVYMMITMIPCLYKCLVECCSFHGNACFLCLSLSLCIYNDVCSALH